MAVSSKLLLLRLRKTSLLRQTCYNNRNHLSGFTRFHTNKNLISFTTSRNTLLSPKVQHVRCNSSLSTTSDTKFTSSSSSLTLGKKDEEEETKRNQSSDVRNSISNTEAHHHVNDDMNNRNNDDESTVQKVMALARPEFGLITASALTLGVTSSITLLLPYASGHVVDISLLSMNGEVGSSMYSPVEAAAGLFGLVSLSGAGVFARSVMLNKAGNRIVARLRKRLFRAALAQETAFFDQVGSSDEKKDDHEYNISGSKSVIKDSNGDKDNSDKNTSAIANNTLAYSNSTTTRTGDLLSRLSSDAQMIQTAVTSHAVGTLRGIVMSTGATIMLVKTSPTLALVSMSTLPPIFFMARRFGKSMKGWQSKVQGLQSDASSLAEEVFSGIKTVRQFAAEPFEAQRYADKIDAAHNEAIKAGKAQALFDGSVHVAANAAILIVIGYGGTMVIAGDITAGELTSFLMYSMLSAGNISSLSTTYADMMKAFGAAGRVFAIIDRVPQIPPTIEVVDRDHHELATAATESTMEAAIIPTGETTANHSGSDLHVLKPIRPLSVELRNIEFAYPSRPDNRILGPNFSLKVNAGENVALVGGSGSGKSTVAALLTRLYDASFPSPSQTRDIRTTSISGDNNADDDISGIFIDGEDICDIDPRWLRENVGVVQQEPLLFAASIADNIRYGRRDASDDEVYQAAKIANVLQFTRDLAGLNNTMVGPRGSQLSGGQKQRVAIARLLLKNPPIIIFDEATSALDAQTEFYLQQAIDEVMKNRTVISIAHRLSTIRSSDRIAVLDSGIIAEEGTFTELVNKKNQGGKFWNLMSRQLTEHNQGSTIRPVTKEQEENLSL